MLKLEILGCFCGELGWVGFLVLFPINNQSQPTKNYFAMAKVFQTPLLTYFFLGRVGLGLGSSFDGFILILICFPTQQNLVSRNNPNIWQRIRSTPRKCNGSQINLSSSTFRPGFHSISTCFLGRSHAMHYT